MLRILAIVIGFCVIAPATARADDAGEAKAFITKQIEMIKTGDLADLKASFTARLQDGITKELVDKAKQQADKVTIDDLVASVTKTGDGLKIKMKNGRSLTTLVKVAGAWKADTIWFK